MDDKALMTCATMFSTHYGTWQHSGKPVTLSPAKLRRDFLFDDSCGLFTNEHGHAFFKLFDYEPLGKICWITQLVCYTKDMKEKVCYAKDLISKVSSSCKCNILAIVSSYPYAIDAVGYDPEPSKTGDNVAPSKTGDNVAPSQTSDNVALTTTWASALLKACGIPYLQDVQLEPNHQVNTKFFIQRLDSVTDLPDGYEYIALNKV